MFVEVKSMRASYYVVEELSLLTLRRCDSIEGMTMMDDYG